jgi:hypothetical protein
MTNKKHELLLDDPYAPQATREQVARWWTEVLPGVDMSNVHVIGPIRIHESYFGIRPKRIVPRALTDVHRRGGRGTS